LSRRHPESQFDRAVGAQYSLPVGEVTESHRRAYMRVLAEAAMSKAPQPQGPAYSALAALYDRDAPGAPLSGKQGTLGEFVQSIYRAGNKTGPAIVNAAMSERIPAEGGALVGEELRSEIALHALESAIIRPRATVIPMREQASRVPVLEEGSNAAGSVFGGLNFTWTEESAALSSSVASFGLDVLRAKKLVSYMVCPNELFEDANKLGTFLQDVIPAGISFAEDAALIAGTGSLGGTTLGGGQPTGILSAGCQIQVTRQTSSEVTVQDVYKMVTRMLPKSMSNFIWLGSPDVLAQLLQVSLNVGSAASGIVPPPLWLDFDPVQGCWTLLKRPFYATEHVSALGTTGDLVAVDPKFVVIGDYQQMEIEVASQGADFVYDESQIRVRSRLDGHVWLAQPVTPANSSATVSPVVILH
jgi:HK97 family phage major capsid protein